MIRFALAGFVAAVLAASMFDHARMAAYEAQIDPAGLAAVGMVAAVVAVLYAALAFASGPKCRPCRSTACEGSPRARRCPFRLFRRKGKAPERFDGTPLWTPSRPPLDPEAPVMRAIRAICREDTRALIAAERPAHIHTELRFPVSPGTIEAWRLRTRPSGGFASPCSGDVGSGFDMRSGPSPEMA